MDRLRSVFLVLAFPSWCAAEGQRGMLDCLNEVKSGQIEVKETMEFFEGTGASTKPLVSWSLHRFRFSMPSRVIHDHCWYRASGQSFEEHSAYRGWSDHGRCLSVRTHGKFGSSASIGLDDKRPYAQGIMYHPVGCLFRLALVVASEGVTVTKADGVAELGLKGEWTQVVPKDGVMSLYAAYSADGQVSKMVQKYKEERLHKAFELSEYRKVDSVPFPFKIVIEQKMTSDGKVMRRQALEVVKASFSPESVPLEFPDNFVPRDTWVHDPYVLGFQVRSDTNEQGLSFEWDPVRLVYDEIHELGFSDP
jgi:hypothetical protein